MTTTRTLHLERKKMWDASMQNHTRYLDPSTGKFASEHLEPRACPVCSSSDSRLIFSKSGGDYKKCECGMVFLDPVFTDGALESYYRNNHSVQAEIVAGDSSFYSSLYNKGLDLIERTVPRGAGGHLLDVGCSAGAFLDIASDRGWQTSGLELNQAEAEIARENGHSVHFDLLQNLDTPHKFAAITLWDVFEHIKDGLTFLETAASYLAPGGCIFLQSPNSEALAARILQTSCNMFDGLEHTNLYSYSTLQHLASRAGLTLAHFETVIAEIGPINNFLNYDDPYLGPTKNRTSIVGWLDEEAILEENLGYKFQAVLTR